MSDPKTGIHEPTLIIPWWIICKDWKQDDPWIAELKRSENVWRQRHEGAWYTKGSK